MADAGYGALVLLLAVSLYTSIAAILGGRRSAAALLQSARNGLLVTAALATIAVGLLLALLLRHDFAVSYVYQHTSLHLPALYTLSALWAGQEGSLLLWLWLLALLSAIALRKRRAARLVAGGNPGADSVSPDAGGVSPDAAAPYVLAALAFTQAFLALVLLLTSNLFARLAPVPQDGQGLNPLLQNFWMVIHPPIVFMGYAAYTVPFALVVGGLLTGHLTREWLGTVRRWALFAWLFLGAGILLGAWWAYQELGWGGYWSWDPVENSSLIPWLTGTALLHALMMQEQRNTWQKWNIWLVTLTFTLCLFATFVTRSGLVQSVHAFGRSSLGYYFIAFILLALGAVFYLASRRRQGWAAPQGVDKVLCRESGLYLTNFLFVGAAGVVLLGILFPAVLAPLQGRELGFGASFYEKTVGPLAQLIVLVIGVCPWLPWGGAPFAKLRRGLLPAAAVALGTVTLLFVSGIRQGAALVAFGVAAFVLASIASAVFQDVQARQRSKGERPAAALLAMIRRSHRRYGGRLAHLGVVLIAVGITGSSLYRSELQVSLSPGESVDFGGYTLKYQQPILESTPLYQRVSAQLKVFRARKQVAVLEPRKDFYPAAQQWVSEVAIRSTPRQDLYIILAGVEADGALASLHLLVNPLVQWLWIGGAVLLLGGGVAGWPSAPKGREP